MDHHNNITPTGRRRSGGLGMVPYSLICIIGFSMFFALPGCSPKIIEKIVVQRDTTVVHHRDSIIRRDSVWMKEYVKGDTVFIEKYKDRYIYRDRWRDSVSVREVHDTTTVEKKVEKDLSIAQKAKIGAFWWLLAGVLGLGAWTFRKPLLSLLKKLI